MANKDVIDKNRNLSKQEQRNISYEELIKIIKPLSSDEIIELSNIIDILYLQDYVWSMKT